MIPAETLHTLEFDKILQTVAGFTNSDPSQKAALALCPLGDKSAIELRLGQVEEIRRLAGMNIPLRLAPFEDIRDATERIRPEGSILAPLELLAFIPPLQIMAALGRQLADRADIPLMLELSGGLTGFPDLLAALERSINQEGAILDTASQLLFDLRGRKRALTARVRKRLEEIVRERQTAIFLQDEFITQRGGRWVIPVRMDAKGMVPGVVHDVSNSGETAFIEPLEIIGLANELENLLADEKVEEIRILRQICHWIREDAAAIGEQFQTVVEIDVLNGIARFAELIQAEAPIISRVGKLRITGGRHPLLMMQARKSGREVVPLDLELGAETVRHGAHAPDRVMVITGPNAGGKTIAVKTAGLMLLMALAGIPVPAAASSEFPFATRLLADIGDEQSIESSLSTFSAHVSRIAAILREADAGSVVLLDELGTGTEPGQGAAIACAVLRELHEKGALVFATTHLTEIVGFVHRTPGMVNAAMEFDRRVFAPLYRLKTGEPGQSHALEVARRYGLPDSVIAFAKELSGRLESDFNALLAEVEERRINYETLLSSIRRREDELADRERLEIHRLDEAKERQREILEKAYQDARDLAQNTRRDINALLEEARLGKTREARLQLAAMEEMADGKIREFHPETVLAPDKMKEGEPVFIRSIGYDGTVLAVDARHGRLRVRAGRMELDIPMSDASPPQGKRPRSREPRKSTPDIEEPNSLKLVGLRIDPALSRLETFLNHAVLGGLGEVRIVHGKGTGALMRAVREHLSDHPLVSSFRGGEQFEGGEGVTVVIIQ
jgi:DNA mismatch repair protein MutS2